MIVHLNQWTTLVIERKKRKRYWKVWENPKKTTFKQFKVWRAKDRPRWDSWNLLFENVGVIPFPV